MQRSIAARYAARPSAQFVRPVVTARRPWLGLRAMHPFRPSSARPAPLRPELVGPFVALKAPWRTITPEGRRPVVRLPLRPVPAVQWTRPPAAWAVRPPDAAPAPWPG